MATVHSLPQTTRDPRTILEELLRVRDRRRQVRHLRQAFDADLVDLDAAIGALTDELADVLRTQHRARRGRR